MTHHSPDKVEVICDEHSPHIELDLVRDLGIVGVHVCRGTLREREREREREPIVNAQHWLECYIYINTQHNLSVSSAIHVHINCSTATIHHYVSCSLTGGTKRIALKVTSPSAVKWVLARGSVESFEKRR